MTVSTGPFAIDSAPELVTPLLRLTAPRTTGSFEPPHRPNGTPGHHPTGWPPQIV